ncbi:MAG: hypothetical protein LBH65_05330 [Desulfovibrio sp.]|jgi:hypothetical protein|nr:hypothetical protein [Desulfovibrio sp.]
MHACAVLLDELLALVPSEENALANEDVDKVKELADKRAELLWKAWQNREGFDEEELRTALTQVLETQKTLHAKAEVLRQSLRERQAAGRKQARYFNGDRHVHAQAQRSFYCDKVS